MPTPNPAPDPKYIVLGPVDHERLKAIHAEIGTVLDSAQRATGAPSYPAPADMPAASTRRRKRRKKSAKGTAKSADAARKREERAKKKADAKAAAAPASPGGTPPPAAPAPVSLVAPIPLTPVAPDGA